MKKCHRVGKKPHIDKELVSKLYTVTLKLNGRKQQQIIQLENKQKTWTDISL